MDAAKYINKLTKGMGAESINVVSAVKLEPSKTPGEGNAIDLAHWCNGTASWDYNPETGTTTTCVLIHSIGVSVQENQWVVQKPDGSFAIYTDESFVDNFVSHSIVPVPTCPHCLADTQKTQYSDYEQRCPLCGSGYVGPPRTRSYEILVAAGMVLEERVIRDG